MTNLLGFCLFNQTHPVGCSLKYLFRWKSQLGGKIHRTDQVRLHETCVLCYVHCYNNGICNVKCCPMSVKQLHFYNYSNQNRYLKISKELSFRCSSIALLFSTMCCILGTYTGVVEQGSIFLGYYFGVHCTPHIPLLSTLVRINEFNLVLF